MAALVQHQQQQGQDMFAPFGAHAYATAAAAAAAMSAGNASRSSSAGRPFSPPQAVPRARQPPAAACSRQPFGEGDADWQDASAAVQVAASPADSEATEQFLDCYSEGELAMLPLLWWMPPCTPCPALPLASCNHACRVQPASVQCA